MKETMPQRLQILTAGRRKAGLVAAGLALLLTLFATGCRLMKSTAELPGKAVGTVTQGKKDQPAVDPVALQQQLMRFADEFSARIATSADQLRRGTNALDRVELQKWKLNYASDTLAIADLSRRGKNQGLPGGKDLNMLGP